MYLRASTNCHVSEHLSGSRPRKRCWSGRHRRVREIAWWLVGEVPNLCDAFADGGVEVCEGWRPAIWLSFLDGLGGCGEGG
jgi:hypothetical protein